MTTKTNSGYSMLAYGSWVDDYERAKREAAIRMREEADNCRRQKITARVTGVTANVIGGSLDGETMPAGTHHGQQYRWDAQAQRWVSVK